MTMAAIAAAGAYPSACCNLGGNLTACPNKKNPGTGNQASILSTHNRRPDVKLTHAFSLLKGILSAIIAAIADLSPEQVTHRGTGIGDDALRLKVKAIKKGLELNRPDPADPLDVLQKVGGLEIAAIAGLVLGCAANRIPVVVDGFISTAGALIASELHPAVRDYLFAAHESVEVGHRFMLERIGIRPILNLDMRLGEGTGAALSMPLLEAGVKILAEMATFEQAGVSGH